MRRRCQRCPRLEAENRRLRRENEQLRRRLTVHENPHTPPSVRGQAPGRMLLPPLKKPEQRRKPGRKPGHEGVTRPPLIPDRTLEWTLEACPSCRGRRLKPTFVEPKDQIEVPPPPPTVVTRYLVRHYECCDCGAECSATLPGGPLQTGYGPNLKAEMVLLRTEQRLPIRRILQVLLRSGVSMSTATALALLLAASQRLSPEYQKIIRCIRRAPVVYADETSFRVDGKKWWLWVFTTRNDVLLVLRPHRDASVPKEILGEHFQGVLGCDGWKVYPGLARWLQRCWAHLLRIAKE